MFLIFYICFLFIIKSKKKNVYEVIRVHMFEKNVLSDSTAALEVSQQKPSDFVTQLQIDELTLVIELVIKLKSTK